MRNEWWRATVVLLLVMVLGTSCGGSDADTEATQRTVAPGTSAPIAVAPSTVVAVTPVAGIATPRGPQLLEVTVGDQPSGFVLQVTEVTVRPGPVSLTLINPAGSVRAHNIVVRTQAGDPDLAKSATANAGESTVLEFTVPNAGTYELYCSLPGHKDRGAKTTLTVQPA